MIRFTNMEHRVYVRFVVCIFMIMMLLIATPLRVSATRTIQIERTIDIKEDPRYDWDETVNYANENATTS